MDCKILESAVDYVTISGKSEQIYGLQSSLQVLIDHYHDIGHKAVEASNRGYHGWRVGPLAILDNGEWAYIQSYGDSAGFVASVAGAYDARCTRIDLQVTLVCGRDASGRPIGDAVYYDALKSKTCPSPTRIESPGGGYTVYIGSRASDRFARVYRKDVESKDVAYPGNTWRYEVELKKPRSQKVWRELLSVPASDRSTQIAAYILDYFTNRGVFCPIDTTQPLRIDDTLSRKKTPIERKLEWIGEGVSPTILDLFDNGYAEDVLRAIGVASSPVIAQHIIRALKALGHSMR